MKHCGFSLNLLFLIRRFSQDIEPLDHQISGQAEQCLNCTFGLISVFVVIVSSMSWFAVMMIPIAYGYFEIQVKLNTGKVKSTLPQVLNNKLSYKGYWGSGSLFNAKVSHKYNISLCSHSIWLSVINSILLDDHLLHLLTRFIYL